MRLFLAPTLLATLFSLPGLSVAFQNRNPTQTKISDARAVFKARQYRVARDTLTTCISVTGSSVAEAAGVVDHSIDDVSTCVCTDNFNVWLTTDANAQILVNALGQTAVTTGVNALLNNQGTSCDFPTNSQPVCIVGQPCAFQCINGYTEVSGQCVCNDPNTVCNGVCGSFPSGCGSSGATARRRNVPKKITTLAGALAICKGKSVCGVPGREKTLDFECVDTSSSLDSCGGCVVPHSFPDPVRSALPLGVDCGRALGVVEAQCSDSKCVVTTCRGGLVVSRDGTQCVPKASNLLLTRDIGTTIVTLGPDVKAKLGEITIAVVTLDDARKAAKQSAVIPAVDSNNLVRDAVDATVRLLSSRTVSDVSLHVVSLVSSMSRYHKEVSDCECLDKPIMDNLDKVIDRAVDLHLYLLNHPVGTARSASGDAVPITSTLPLKLDVSGLLLALAKIKVGSNIQSPVVDKTVSLLKLALNINLTSTALGTSSRVAAPGEVSPSSLINAVALAASDLSASRTFADLLVNLNVLLNANNVATTSLSGAEGTASDTLASLDRVGKAALDLKSTINSATDASELNLAFTILQDKELYAALTRVARRAT